LSYSRLLQRSQGASTRVITLHPPVLMGFASAAQGKNP
jgi:hypothetical protein